MSLNLVVLIGNLGSDPEVRATSNSKVANFSLATSESFKDKTTGEKKSETTWHNIVLWKNWAEVAEKYLKKGMKISIQGKIKTRSYDGKDGQKKYITEIIGEAVTMLGEKPAHTQEQVVQSSGYSAPADNSTDDLPF